MGKGTSALRTAVAGIAACFVALVIVAAPAWAQQTPTADQYGQPLPGANTPAAPSGNDAAPSGGTGTSDPGGTNTPSGGDEDPDVEGGGTGGVQDGCNDGSSVSSAGASSTCPEPAADGDTAPGTGQGQGGGTLPVADSSGGLPFTGLALGALVLVACLMLAAGLLIHSVQRWLGRRPA